jgi:hypothetical protein
MLMLHMIREPWRTVARKRPPKISPEEQARFDELTREINARIAERRAREREQDSPGPRGR